MRRADDPRHVGAGSLFLHRRQSHLPRRLELAGRALSDSFGLWSQAGFKICDRSSHSMTDSVSRIAQLLRNCEKSGLAPNYLDTPPVQIDSRGGDIFVISDLHLASGKRYDGTYTGCENFFYDQSFESFLEYLNSNIEPNDPRALLVINGDFVDFLRVGEIPLQKDEFVAWEELLNKIGYEPKQTSDQLENSIEREKN